jgi:hypothetical protein
MTRNAQIHRLSLDPIGPNAQARLVLDGVRHSRQSYLIFIYLNMPEGVAPFTPEAEPHLVGKLAMYGMGTPVDPSEGLPETAPFQMEMALPPALRGRLRCDAPNHVTLALADAGGHPLPPELLRFRQARMVSDGAHDELPPTSSSPRSSPREKVRDDGEE